MARKQDREHVTADDRAHELKLRLRALQDNAKGLRAAGEHDRVARLEASISKLREELDANAETKEDGNMPKSATPTKKQSKKDEATAVARAEAERTAKQAERAAERAAQVEAKIEAIAERIRENEGEVARADLEEFKPDAAVAKLMKEKFGLTYGKKDGRGTWKLPVA